MAPSVSPARPRALVTGASAGIGVAFAERLARAGHDLVLVARRRDRLVALADRLERETGAQAEVVCADLNDPSALARVEAITAADENLVLLVNNAGFGGYKPFLSIDPKTIDDLIDIHIRAVTRLTRAALPGMVRRGKGGVINVASLLALSGNLPPDPLPFRATYAGAKSFLLTFTQTLAGELKDTGVQVQVCLPGRVDTEFHSLQGFDTTKLPPSMIAQDIATAALAGLALGEVVCVPALADAASLDRLAESELAVFRAATQSKPALAPRYREAAGAS
ncbi:MAG: SDR family NAD(P)-dependent oxidoreductase [Hyphomicrobiales bacterium]|nr:SDR family NAD(P)-dependent oxidoreductase [Hyphomicrobiales bacterium]